MVLVLYLSILLNEKQQKKKNDYNQNQKETTVKLNLSSRLLIVYITGFVLSLW